MAYQTINPYTNEVVKTYDNATTDQIEQALTTGDALITNGVMNPLVPVQPASIRLPHCYVNIKMN